MEERDHVDRFLDSLSPELELDREVEGIVDRIGGLNRRIKRSAEQTIADFGLGYGEWHVLGRLHNQGPRLSPGGLAKGLELSSGAMTNRLDGLEKAGLVRRLPDPDDRRALLVELTDEGRRLYRASVAAQAAKESIIAEALSADEQRQLNALLRRVMLAFEARESRG
jgi:DNA-binding MarR family transcriptional regulator